MLSFTLNKSKLLSLRYLFFNVLFTILVLKLSFREFKLCSTVYVAHNLYIRIMGEERLLKLYFIRHGDIRENFYFISSPKLNSVLKLDINFLRFRFLAGEGSFESLCHGRCVATSHWKGGCWDAGMDEKSSFKDWFEEFVYLQQTEWLPTVKINRKKVLFR